MDSGTLPGRGRTQARRASTVIRREVDRGRRTRSMGLAPGAANFQVTEFEGPGESSAFDERSGTP